MGVLRRVVGVALPVLAVGLVVPGLAASRHEPRSLVLHLKFHQVTLGSNEGVLADGRYVFYDERMFGPIPQSSEVAGVLVDERTGRRRSVSPPAGCGGDVQIGGSWLMFICSTPQGAAWLELYAPLTDKWRTVSVPQPTCYESMPGYCFSGPAGVGAHWIEFVQSQCYHCGEFRRFKNIQTGALRSDPSTATTIPDLNRPGLARRVCAPLRVPINATAEDLPLYQSFVFFGPYGVASEDAANPGQLGPWEGDLVQRCGSHRKRATGAIGNSHLLLMPSQTQPDALDGSFLPNGPKFTIPIPADARRAIYQEGGVALSDRALFLGTSSNASIPHARIWVAALPAKPPPRPPRN